MASKEITGVFTGAGEFSAITQGSEGHIIGHSGAGSMQLQIDDGVGGWTNEGTSILQDQVKQFYLSASVRMRLASEGAISYTLRVR